MSSELIKSRNLTINIFDNSDITNEYIQWLNDPEVVRYSNQRFQTHTKESCKEYFKSFIGTNNLFLSIYLNRERVSIGTMTVYVNHNHSTADIGIMIGNKKYWGRGFGKEAWNLVMSYLFFNKKIRKITAGAIDRNIAMIELMKKTGMKPDGVRVKHELFQDNEHDILYFAVFNNNFIKI